MLYIFTETSKYMILGFMILYALECVFYEIKGERADKSRGIYIRQDLYLFMIQALSYATLCLKTGKLDYAFFCLFVQIVLFGCIILTILMYPKADRMLLNNMVLLLSIGFIILGRLDFNKALKQFAIVAVSLIACMFIPAAMKKMKGLKEFGYVYSVIGALLLLTVLILGTATHGSKLSYSIGGISFQPSEIVKIIFVFAVAALLGKAETFFDIVTVTFIAAAHVLILVLSKDLGSGLIFFIAYICMLFIATRNYVFLFLGLGSGVAASILAYRIFTHVQVRVSAFLDPFSSIDREGYQITQSLFAIGCGNFFGTGLNKGAPGDIPYVWSDFIFSAVSEEFGGIFAILMLVVCISSFVIIMRASINGNGRFYRLLAGGFGAMYIFQVFLTVGGGIKFIPLTGVTLPFVSYGGTSVLSSVCMMYVVLEVIIDYRTNAEVLKADDETMTIRKPRTFETWLTVSFFGTLYAAMIIYFCIYVANNEQTLISNSYNSRQKILAQENTRGSIYDRGGKVLAQTLTDAVGKEYRDYPYANLFAHTVGFSTKGKTGIESSENYYLLNSNIPLNEKVENDVAGRKNPGNNVYTTLDYELQKVASDSLGVCRGAVIVSEVKTGKILAMVSKPDFDPNTVAADWDKYLNDTGDESVLLNRATQGLYPPGSTFKIVTTLEYIKENSEDYENYSYNCSGSYRNGDIKINCFHGSVHNRVDLAKSFAKSCNSSFANIGMSLDRDRFGKTLKQLKFNEKLPLDINYSISKLKVDNYTTDEDMAQISIGQGKAGVSPMLLHLITNAIACDGTANKPMLVDHIEDADGNVIKQYEPERYANMMTPEEAGILTELMKGVVQNGTGTRLQSAFYEAAGKTGSAEFGGNKEDSHAWFTGFAPADDPEISVTIIVENIGSGGEYAVPIAKRIIDAYLGVY